jgi:hypothetical protein
MVDTKFYVTGSSASGVACRYRLSNGSTSSKTAGFMRSGATDSARYASPSFYINVPDTSSDVTINLQHQSASGACVLHFTSTLDKQGFDVYYFPDNPTEVIASRCENPIDCETVFSAKVSNTGVVSDENLDWIDGNGTTSGNVTTLNFNAGLFSVAPVCVVSYFDASTTGFIRVNTISSTSVAVAFNDTNAIGVLRPFTLVCQRQGEDYKKAKINYQLAQLKASNVDGGVDFGLGNKMISGYAHFSGASDNTICNASPCTKRIMHNDLLGMSLTRTSVGRYNLSTSEVFKPNSNVMCSYECRNPSATTFSFAEGSVTLKYATNSSGAIIDARLGCVAVATLGATDSYVMVKCTGERK